MSAIVCACAASRRSRTRRCPNCSGVGRRRRGRRPRAAAPWRGSCRSRFAIAAGRAVRGAGVEAVAGAEAAPRRRGTTLMSSAGTPSSSATSSRVPALLAVGLGGQAEHHLAGGVHAQEDCSVRLVRHVAPRLGPGSATSGPGRRYCTEFGGASTPVAASCCSATPAGHISLTASWPRTTIHARLPHRTYGRID